MQEEITKFMAAARALCSKLDGRKDLMMTVRAISDVASTQYALEANATPRQPTGRITNAAEQLGVHPNTLKSALQSRYFDATRLTVKTRKGGVK